MLLIVNQPSQWKYKAWSEELRAAMMFIWMLWCICLKLAGFIFHVLPIFAKSKSISNKHFRTFLQSFKIHIHNWDYSEQKFKLQEFYSPNQGTDPTRELTQLIKIAQAANFEYEMLPANCSPWSCQWGMISRSDSANSSRKLQSLHGQFTNGRCSLLNDIHYKQFFHLYLSLWKQLGLSGGPSNI